MTEFIKTLPLLSASGSVLGLLLILARRVGGRRLPSTLWYYAWLPVLLRLVLPLPGLIPAAQVPAGSAPPVLMQAETLEKRSYRYDGDGAYFASGTEDGEADTSAAEAAVPLETVVEAEMAEPTRPRVQPGVILKSPGFWLAVWLAGAALCFGRYAAGYVRFRRVLMRTMQTTDGLAARVCRELTGSRGPRLFSSEYVKTPMLLGLFRPLIVLPQGAFSEDTVRNVLRHELTHYRRGDLYVKWFFVFAASLHWFNPLMPLFWRELDRVCELSCDESVLARMEPSQRRSYGETLLDLAANRTLPAGVVATTFATEKRALKERLEQIMKFRFKPRAILALTIAALLLMGTLALAAAPARASAASADRPEPTPMPAASAEASGEASALVSLDVDELLAAIAPDTTITLSPGLYDLSMASDYGQATDSAYYRWEEVNDGYELVIENVENLSIVADPNNAAATVISAVPRYADVLAFSDCGNITLSGLTAGHTVEQGQCMGGVVHLMGTDNVSVESCALYGCGVLGIEAENCQNILVSDSDIYECSNGAVQLTSCRYVRLDGCTFRDCCNRYGDGMNPAMEVLSIRSCYGVAVTDGRVCGNFALVLMHVEYSQEIYLLGTLFEDNAISDEMAWHACAVFDVEGDPVIMEGCEFRDDAAIYSNSESVTAVSPDGKALSYNELAAMKQAHTDFRGFAEMETPVLDRRLGEDGMYEVHVSTVDELLAAIAPNTVIYLDAGLYYLTDATNYGAYGGVYYYWVRLPDGPGLVISGVENLSIIGAGKDATRIEALPRYADVIRFEDCRNVAVRGVTAGHTQGAGSCSGSVLEFWGCEGVEVTGCGLFGCGTYGVTALDSTGITVEENEIYECSFGAVALDTCVNAVFASNDIHDCAYPTYRLGECLDITVDGEAVFEEEFVNLDPGFAAYLDQEADNDPILGMIVERGAIIFNAAIDVPGAGPYFNPAALG